MAARLLRVRIPPRFIGAAAQFALGVITLTQPNVAGTSFAFIERQFHGSSQAIGFAFVVSGLLLVVDTYLVLHIISCLFLCFYALVALWGALVGESSLQPFIAFTALALYALQSFPPERER